MFRRELNWIEYFLVHVQQEEERVFNNHPEYLLLPVIPFFQLTCVLNVKNVIDKLLEIAKATNGSLVRHDGYMALALDEVDYKENDLRRMLVNLLDIMRF